jgi:PAS domain S-box-containing protein
MDYDSIDTAAKIHDEPSLARQLELGEVTFGDLFSVEELQRIQDEFAAATGVASLITSPDGTPITRPSNFTRLCGEIIRGSALGCANCFKSDASIGRYHPDGPIVQTCLSGGLWDAGASISVGGHHVANWLIGQVRDGTRPDEAMLGYARSIGVDEVEFMEALKEVPAMNRTRFGQIAQALFTLANQLSKVAYQNLEQARMIAGSKHTEDVLRETNEYLENLFTYANAPIIVWSPDFRITRFNHAFETLTGRSAADVLGKPVWILFPPGSIDSSMELIRKAQTGERWETVEIEVGNTDGTVRTVLWNSSAIFSADGATLLATIAQGQDITERVRAEKKIQWDETRLRMLVDIFQHPSETIQEFLDYSLQKAIELTRSKIGYIYFYSEDRKEFVLNSWSRVVMAECTVINPSTTYALDMTGIWGEAVRQRRTIVVNDYDADNPLKKGYPQGHVRLSKFMTIPIFKDGAIVGVVGLANKETDYDDSDILQISLLMDAVWKVTERKEAEAEVKRLLEENRLLLKEVHHRIKNNMSTIQSLISLQAGLMREPSAVAALEDTGSRVQTMMILYDKLYRSVNFSRLSTLEYLPSLVDELLGNFPNLASIRVTKHIDDFMLDISQIQPLGILIGELLTNVMKYAFVGRNDGEVLVAASLEGSRATVVVQDNGRGFPDTVSFDNSTGFGLTLAKALAEQLGGSIRIERGNGTRMVIEFEVSGEAG